MNITYLYTVKNNYSFADSDLVNDLFEQLCAKVQVQQGKFCANLKQIVSCLDLRNKKIFYKSLLDCKERDIVDIVEQATRICTWARVRFSAEETGHLLENLQYLIQGSGSNIYKRSHIEDRILGILVQLEDDRKNGLLPRFEILRILDLIQCHNYDIPSPLLIEMKKGRISVSRGLLYVEKVNEADFPQMARIARLWYILTGLKGTKDLANSEVFESSSCACDSLVERFSTQNAESTEEFAICKDHFGSVQAIINYEIEKDHIFIIYLATHPGNIKSPLNLNERTTGAGTSLIHYIEEQALKTNKKIRLIPMCTSITFYEKEDFKSVDAGQYMEKTIDKIQAAIALRVKAA